MIFMSLRVFEKQSPVTRGDVVPIGDCFATCARNTCTWRTPPRRFGAGECRCDRQVGARCGSVNFSLVTIADKSNIISVLHQVHARQDIYRQVLIDLRVKVAPMSTNDGSEKKSGGSATTVTIVLALISAVVTIIVAFKDPIAARLFPTPTPISPAHVGEPTAIPVPVTEPILQPLATEASPDLQFESCPLDTSCPNHVKIREVVGNPDPFVMNTEYAADISSDAQIRFVTGWCARDQQWLDDNLQHIQFFFAINGVSYQDRLGAEYYTGTGEYSNCYGNGVGVSNWQAGVIYRIGIGGILDADLFDGGSITPKGEFHRTFILTVK